MKDYLHKYFNVDLPKQQFLFNWITLAGIVAGVISSVFSVIAGLPVIVALIALALAACMSICFYIANYYDMLESASYYVCIFVALVAFPEMFLLSGGVHSGMPIWFVMATMLTFFLLNGKGLWIVVGLELAMYSFVIWGSYAGVLDVAELGSEMHVYLDIWQSALIVSVCMGVVINSQVRIYEKELQKNEEQRIRMEVLKVEAEKASIAKSDFLANMSHEIRTPLNAIIGLSRIALRNDMPAQVRNDIEDILNSSNNLLSIINDILDFSKIESGKLEIVHAKYQLSSLIYDVSTIIHFRLGDKPIDYIEEIEPSIPNTLYGDEVRIKQILINILGNAAKFTKKGKIVLKIDWKRLGGIAILNISISDTGQGIRQENLDQIFERFKRVEMQDNRQIEGTGLGLSITKSLLDRMGGVITAESTYGKGSTFTITIPQKIIDEKPMYGEVRGSARHNFESKELFDSGTIFPGANVLVVDDNAMNLKVAKGLLAPYRMNVKCVGGARECLEEVSQMRYDLILLDHMMPEMDGVETLWRMREDPNFNTPVIALTANAISGAKKQYLDWGFMDYLSKPMHLEELETCLKKYLKGFMRKETLEEKAAADAAASAEREAEAEKAAAEAKRRAKEREAERAESESAADEAPEEISAQAAQAESAEPEEETLEPDPNIFNVEQGMEYAVDDQDFYIETLHIYLDETEGSAMMLREYLEAENMKDYEVLVHALKSNSRLVGAVATSELALELEEQSRDDNLEFVKAHHEELMERLALAKKYIRQYLREHE